MLVSKKEIYLFPTIRDFLPIKNFINLYYHSPLGQICSRNPIAVYSRPVTYSESPRKLLQVREITPSIILLS